MLTDHVRKTQDTGVSANLLTLVLLIAVMGLGGAVLYRASGPPHLPSSVPSWSETGLVLQSSEFPPGFVVYVLGTAGWVLLTYIAVTILLRVVVDLVVAIARENPLAR